MTEMTTAPPPLGLRRADRARPVVRVRLTGQVPAHPLTADHLTAVAAWNGATNQRYGTCGPCSVANSLIMTRKVLAGQDVSVSDTAIFDLYRRSGNPGFDPATGAGDDGVDMTVMLAEVVRNGLEVTHSDGTTGTARPLLFGALDLSQYETVHAATSIFGGLALALDLDQAQQAQTSAGLWDYVPGSRPWGGHAVLGGSYTSAAGAHDPDEGIVTWQQRVATSPGFLGHQLYGGYALVWPEQWDHPAFQAGVDRPALVAGFEALTGRAWAGPDPGPPPVPPAPEVPPAVSRYLGDPAMLDWSARRHAGRNEYAARQFRLLRNAMLRNDLG